MSSRLDVNALMERNKSDLYYMHIIVSLVYFTFANVKEKLSNPNN